jgi:hypothetical protein
MRNRLFLIAYLFLSPLSIAAQLRLGVSPAFAVPVGDFGAINKNGYGLSLTGKYKLGDRWALATHMSYYAFGRAGEDLSDLGTLFDLKPTTIEILAAIGTDIKVPNTDFFPVNFGFEYYFLQSKVRPYAGFDIGMYFIHTQNVALKLSELVQKFYELQGTWDDLPQAQKDIVNTLGSINLNGSDANFGVAPVLGCTFQFSEKWHLDLNSKANFVIVPDKKSAATVISVNLGVFFELD